MLVDFVRLHHDVLAYRLPRWSGKHQTYGGGCARPGLGHAGAMTEPINLNKARKAREKAQAKSQAAQNRVRFGRTKAEKQAASLEVERAGRAHDEKKRES